jgi:hypothetical protein
MAGLLTYTLFTGLPVMLYCMTVAKVGKKLTVLTAAGTVPGFHRIPFSFRHWRKTINSRKYIKMIQAGLVIYHKTLKTTQKEPHISSGKLYHSINNSYYWS